MVGSSQGAVGILQAVQATNQLLALMAKQTMQSEQLRITQDRATALQSSQTLEADQVGQATRLQFQGSGVALHASTRPGLSSMSRPALYRRPGRLDAMFAILLAFASVSIAVTSQALAEDATSLLGSLKRLAQVEQGCKVNAPWARSGALPGSGRGGPAAVPRRRRPVHGAPRRAIPPSSARDAVPRPVRPRTKPAPPTPAPIAPASRPSRIL